MNWLAPAARAFAFVAAFGCAVQAQPPPAPQAPAVGRVLVYYPAGDCGGELQIELYDRAAAAWRAHPEHPRLPVGACASEPPEQLLNELRVRCADPAGKRPPSAWVVGAELASAQAPCGATPSR